MDSIQSLRQTDKMEGLLTSHIFPLPSHKDAAVSFIVSPFVLFICVFHVFWQEFGMHGNMKVPFVPC